MKFLLDQNQSPHMARQLADAGHDTVHVRDLELATAPDEVVLEAARDRGRVLVSADTDFADHLAATAATGPSILLLRRQQNRRSREIADLILANLDAVADDLSTGAVVVLDDDRVRIRALPIER